MASIYSNERMGSLYNNKVISKGEGFYLIDSDGNKYLDGIASMWCNVWGHGQNEVTNAMIEQIKFFNTLHYLA